ncbi:MAG: YciI family protein [Defluviicoccus sp.]|nr:YciI family protein [Defluviicoccus sp.]MDE0382931.1 YciI family protein [Defluviicoccus sp.]
MYYSVFATDKPGAAGVRNENTESFRAYLDNHPDHPNVVRHIGGRILGDDGETVMGLMIVIEAPSLEEARAFVADSPYGQANMFEDLRVQPWDWITGSPG